MLLCVRYFLPSSLTVFCSLSLSLPILSSRLYILYASLCVFNADEWAACWRTHADTEVDISLDGDQETRNKADKGEQRVIGKGGKRNKGAQDGERMEEKRRKEPERAESLQSGS